MPGSGWNLYLKGKDNEKAIARLSARPGSPPSIFDHVVSSGDTNKELQAIRVSVPAGTGKSLGFVLDANGGPGTARHSAVAPLRRSALRCRALSRRATSPGGLPAGRSAALRTVHGLRARLPGPCALNRSSNSQAAFTPVLTGARTSGFLRRPIKPAGFALWRSRARRRCCRMQIMAVWQVGIMTG